MNESTQRLPLRRTFLGLAVAGVLGAICFTALMAPRWMESGQRARQDLPVLATVPDFELQNRDGSILRRSDLAGRPWVADFIFTRCRVSCPVMTLKMAALQKQAVDTPFVSVTVDPEHDTPEVLQAFAESFDPKDEWYFLTGEKEVVYDLIRGGFKLGVQQADPDAPGAVAEPFTHSSRFVLVDAQGAIRGYYDAFDPGALSRLQTDLRTLLR